MGLLSAPVITLLVEAGYCCWMYCRFLFCGLDGDVGATTEAWSLLDAESSTNYTKYLRT